MMNEELGQETITEKTENIGETDKPSEPTLEQIQVASEEKARKTGWLPEGEFRGNSKGWLPADKWNDRGDEYIPFIKAELKDTKAELTGLKDENNDLQERYKSLKSVVKQMTTVQDKYGADLYNKSVSEIEERELRAVEDGDTEEFQRLREQKAAIEKPKSVAEPETSENDEQGQATPRNLDYERWEKENPWFVEDPVMRRYAVSVANELEEAGDKANNYAFFEKVKAKMREDIPDKFTNPNQRMSKMDESSIRDADTAAVTGGSAKGWDDLPREAQQQCKKLMSEDPNYTKEEYVSYYPFDEE